MPKIITIKDDKIISVSQSRTGTLPVAMARFSKKEDGTLEAEEYKLDAVSSGADEKTGYYVFAGNPPVHVIPDHKPVSQTGKE